MMPDIYVNIDGQNHNVDSLTNDVSRDFRDAWCLNGDVVMLDPVKADEIVCEKIDACTENVCAQGIVWNGAQFGYQSNADRDLKLAILDMLKEGATNPHNGYIKDMSGNKVMMDDAEAEAMLKKLRLYTMQVVQASHDAKDNLPTDLENFTPATDITWPSNNFTYP